MARTATRPELPAIIQSAIEAIIGALDARDRELAAWQADADRRPRADHRDGIARINDEARGAIDAAGAAIDAEVARIDREYARHRTTSYNATEIESAWRRVRELLDSGIGVSDVIAGPTFDRVTAEAIRRNYPSWLLAATRGADPADSRRQADAVEAEVTAAELPRMGNAERYATEQSIGARAGRAAVEAISNFLSSDRGAQAQIRLGHELSDAGFVPPPPTTQPLAEAERDRNSLPPELRDKLDGNAGAVGWAEPSLGARSG